MELSQNQLKNLQSLVTGEPSDWKEKARYRKENKKWLQYSQSIAFEILQELRVQGLSQKDLAAKMGVSPQQVNKWVKGAENFTIDTVAKLEIALNIKLLSIGKDSEKSLYPEQNIIDAHKERANKISTERTSIQVDVIYDMPEAPKVEDTSKVSAKIMPLYSGSADLLSYKEY